MGNPSDRVTEIIQRAPDDCPTLFPLMIVSLSVNMKYFKDMVTVMLKNVLEFQRLPFRAILDLQYIGPGGEKP